MLQREGPREDGVLSGSRNPLKRAVSVGSIFIILACFVWLNLRHFTEPFRDYGPPFEGEAFYAIRAANYLRHGYISNWFGVCTNLNPHPSQLVFKVSEMPAYFVVHSLGFRFFGLSTSTYRAIEMAYAVLLFVVVAMGTLRVFDGKTAVLTGVIMLIAPVNMFLLYTSWIFVFPLASLFLYVLWYQSRSGVCYALAVVAFALGCLHHFAGYFVVPAIIIHALVEKSFAKNFRAICGFLLAAMLIGGAYATQTFLLHHNLQVLSEKARWESPVNVAHLREAFSLHLRKQINNFYELVTIPLAVLSAWWAVGAMVSRERDNSAKRCVFLLLLFPLIFSLIFPGLIVSHFHFLTMFVPFMALATSRVLLGWRVVQGKHRTVQLFSIGAFIVYLTFMSYRAHSKYDSMIWNRFNEGGHALASVLNDLLGQNEAVAGVYENDRCYDCMSPAFCFYLDRNYYDSITSVDQFLELVREERISLFLVHAPMDEGPSRNEKPLTDYLSTRFRSYVDPVRHDVLIFDLRRPLNEKTHITSGQAESEG
jgi:hypothetical protein